MTLADQSQLTHEVQAQLAVNQMCYRHLFSEFLRLLNLILKMPQTPDTLKLLNETFVGNATWQETVKNFSISLWLQDVVSAVVVAVYNKFNNLSGDAAHFANSGKAPPPLTLDEKYIIFENIESLRGVNVLNFDEACFFRQVDYIHQQSNLMIQVNQIGEKQNNIEETDTLDLREITSNQVEFLFSQCVTVLEYTQSIFGFYKQAIDVFFPVQHTQQK